MIRRVRRKFIIITMAMLTTVLLVPLVALNAVSNMVSFNQTQPSWNSSPSVKGRTGKKKITSPNPCRAMKMPLEMEKIKALCRRKQHFPQQWNILWKAHLLQMRKQFRVHCLRFVKPDWILRRFLRANQSRLA